MFRLFEGMTADEVWRKAAAAFRDEDVSHQGSRAGQTREILRAVLSIQNPRQRWVASRTPAMNPAFALAEVIWMMAGRNDSAFVNQFNSKLPEYAGCGDTYHGAYGHRLRVHLGIDQLTRAYEALKHNPDSRQVVLQIWDGQADLPDAHGVPASQDVPCNLLAMLKIRDGRLEWTQVVRSNDLMLGVPYNIIQFTSIQEILAGWIGVKLGSFNILSDSLHVYERDMGSVCAATTQVIPEWEESLAVSKPESEHAITVIANAIDRIRAGATSTVIDSLIGTAGVEAPFENILRVLAADLERRHGRTTHSSEIMSRCTNPVYVELWRRWERRLTKRDQRF